MDLGNKSDQRRVKDKVAKMRTVKHSRVETFLSVHRSASHVYVVTRLPEFKVRHDLYYLIHIRAHFTDAQMGEVAYQLLEQMTSIHK